MTISVSDLQNIEEIKQLKARYFRFLDTKDWQALRTVFTDDAQFDVAVAGTMHSAEPSRYFDNADEFVTELSKFLQPAVTVHQGHMPEIVITGEGTARGIWAMFDHVGFPERPDRKRTVGYGHYEESYRQEGAEWKISFLRLTRLHVERLDHAPRILGGPARDPGWLARLPPSASADAPAENSA
jgi:hypothetical protein